MKIQVVTFKITKYNREVEGNDTKQSLLATLKAAGIDGVTKEWYGVERNGISISAVSPDSHVRCPPFRGIRFRVGKEMRRVMVKNGEIDDAALRSKLAEMEAVARRAEEAAARMEERREARKAREFALANEAGLPPSWLIEAVDGTYGFQLLSLTRDQVLAVGRALKHTEE